MNSWSGSTFSAGPGRRWLLRLMLVVTGLMLAVVAAEALLRVGERLDLGDQSQVEVRSDPRLGSRVVPFSGGLDQNGFRNDAVPSRADIVAIGDSQTWGVNARRTEAWPQQLARLTGRVTYNISNGGFGTVHYWVMTSDALKLSPQVIVFGVYFGNDLYDSYHLVYSLPAYADLRDPHALSKLIPDTVEPRAKALWEEHIEFQRRFGRSDPANWGLWLRGHTAIGRMVERAHFSAGDAWFEVGSEWARSHPDHGTVCDCGAVRTVLTTAYRELAVDLDEPRIAEGLRLSKLALREAGRALTAARVRFVVLLIPTKERVYADLLRAKGAAWTETYSRLVINEDRARADLSALCVEQRIECVDALEVLSQGVASGQAVYPPSTESHPNGLGYSLLARLVAERLRRPAVEADVSPRP